MNKRHVAIFILALSLGAGAFIWLHSEKVKYDDSIKMETLQNYGVHRAEVVISHGPLEYYWTGEWSDVQPEMKSVFLKKYQLSIRFGHTLTWEEDEWMKAFNAKIDIVLVQKYGKDFWSLVRDFEGK